MSFIDLICLNVKSLCKEYEERLQNPTKKGFWYGADFYKCFGQKDRSWDFFHGHLPKEAFNPIFETKSLTGRSPFTFQMKQDIRASLALNKAKEGLSLVDCGIIASLAVYQAALTFLGEETFNRLAAKELILTGTLGNPLPPPLCFFMKYQRIHGEEDIRKGDICYFSNIAAYSYKHPAGESQGQYVICCEETPHKYWGLGLSSQGSEQDLVEYELLDCYNRAPLEEDYYPPLLWKGLYSRYFLKHEEKSRELIRSYKETTLTLDAFKKIPAGISSRFLTKRKLALWVYRPQNPTRICPP